jgi:hypothetical protein
MTRETVIGVTAAWAAISANVTGFFDCFRIIAENRLTLTEAGYITTRELKATGHGKFLFQHSNPRRDESESKLLWGKIKTAYH